MGRPNSSAEQLRYSAVEAFTVLNSSSFVPSSICRAHPWALVLSLSLGACSTLQPQTQPVFNDLRIAAAGTGEDPAQSVSYHVLAAEMAAGRNRPDIAATHFLQASEATGDTRLAARATALALAADDQAVARKAASHWLALDPQDGTARELLLRLHLRNGELAETLKHAQILASGHAAGIDDGLRAVALLLRQETAYSDAAMVVMHQLAAPYQDRPGTHYAVGLLALSTGKLDLAQAAAEQALKLEPTHAEAGLLLASALVKLNRLEAADQQIEQMLIRSADPVALRLGYAKLLLDAEANDRAAIQLNKVIKAAPDNEDARFALGVLELKRGNLEGAKPQFRALMKSGERRSEAAYYLGRIAQAEAQPAEALTWYEQVNSGNNVVDAVVRRATLLADAERLDEARYLLLQLRRQLPRIERQVLLTEAELLTRAGAHDEALKLFAAALEDYPDDADLIYGRSLVFEQRGQIDLAERDLRTLIETDTEDARALNALGYMLAVHRPDRLREARQLVSRALALTPDDAAVIDSMGWIEFRLGNVQAAYELLKQAYAKLDDPEIAAHLGEVLWQLGRQSEAREIWTAALAADPDHRVLNETVKRLTQ